MTARYLGMNRSDGLTVTDLEHISQSIGDILRTPVGSRVMRRDYGSLLASMIDQPQTPALELQIKVACYMAVLKWEPRVTLSSVTTARSFDGRMTVTLTVPALMTHCSSLKTTPAPRRCWPTRWLRRTCGRWISPSPQR